MASFFKFNSNNFIKYLLILIKRFSIFLIIMLLPLFALVGAAIKMSSPGPVFCLEPRIGLNKKSFYIIKFRTNTISTGVLNKYKQISLK